MPRKPSGDFNQLEYIRGYVREQIVYKKLSLNRGNPEDMKLLEWIEKQPEGVSAYLKRLIIADREARQ